MSVPKGEWPDWRSGAGLLPPAAVVLWAAVALRWPAMNPRSLWLDDAWVAYLVKYAGFADLFTYPASAPTGFVAILKPFWWLIGDPELSLQLFPFLAGLGCVVGIGVTVSRLTGWPSLGLVAAACLAVNPFLVTYSARVKQYPSDCLVVILLMLWGLPRIGDSDPARLARLAAWSLAALILSFVSVFVSVPLLHLPLVRPVLGWLRGRAPGPYLSLAAVAAFDACAALFYFERLRYQTRPALAAFWNKAFLPLDSVDSVVAFLARHGVRAVESATPFAIEILLPLMLVGLVWLLVRPATRLQGVFFLTVFAMLVAASVTRSYPLGGGRTDIFHYPVTILLASAGAAAVATLLSRLSPVIKPVSAGAFAIAAVVLAVTVGSPAEYPGVDNARLVRMLTRMAKKHDGVVVHWNAVFTLGYYSNWPMYSNFERSRHNKFYVRPARRGSVIAGRGSRPFDPDFLADKRRVLYFETHIFPGVRERRTAIYDVLSAGGFEPVRTIERQWARIIVYEAADDKGDDVRRPARTRPAS